MKKPALLAVVVCGLCLVLPVQAEETVTGWAAVNTAPGGIGTPTNGHPGGRDRALVYYGDRATFDAANPGLPVEDFETGQVAPGEVMGCDAPINNGTASPGCFNVGDILVGISFEDDPGPDLVDLVILGSGFNGNPSVALLANTFADAFVIDFNPIVRAAGMDIQCHFFPDTVDIEIFAQGGVSVGTTTASCTNAGAFFGVESDTADGIESIHIYAPTDQGEGVDDIAFGGVPVPVELMSFDVE